MVPHPAGAGTNPYLFDWLTDWFIDWFDWLMEQPAHI
jgi:hypothetical protein